MKAKEIKNMNKAEMEKKFKELKFELVKAKSNASKTGSKKTKEIRKIMARIITFNNQTEEKSGKGVELKK
jgi:ribosomal protein L29